MLNMPKKSVSTTTYTCSSCRKEFPSEKIRYTQDGKRLICVECSTAVKGSVIKETNALKTSSVTNVVKQQPKVVVAANPDAPVSLMCISCKYKFTTKKSKLKSGVICPYCGKDKLMRNDTSATKLNKLISESGDSRYDY